MQSAIVVVILENENADEIYVVVRKIEKVVVSGNRGCRKHICRTYSSALGVVM